MDKVIKLRNIKSALKIDPKNSLTSYLLNGRVSSVRVYKNFSFLDLNDGSTQNTLQVVVPKDILPKPEIGSFITCQGSIVASKGNKQSLEFKAEQLKYLGRCDPSSYPLATTNENTNEALFRRVPHLRPRNERFASLLRLRSELEFSLDLIMKQMDFFRVSTPCLTSNDSEASSDLFLVKRTKLKSVGDSKMIKEKAQLSSDHIDSDGTSRVLREDFFNRDVFLVTSAQLHLESLASSLSRVYTISPAFRAENSLTTRHLCEFTMFEAEEAGLTNLEQLMDRVETVIKFVGQYLSEVSEYRSDFSSMLEMNSNSAIFDKMTNSNYIRMDYSEALSILRSMEDSNGPIDYGCDIGRVQERKLLDYCNNTPIFITNFPKHLKPFYMKCDERQERALCFDLIAPHGGEICGASLREDSYERLKLNLEEQHQDDNFSWYLDLRLFGTFPHGGFGIGLERLLQSIMGIKNIKDTVAFPRWAGHCPM